MTYTVRKSKGMGDMIYSASDVGTGNISTGWSHGSAKAIIDEIIHMEAMARSHPTVSEIAVTKEAWEQLEGLFEDAVPAVGTVSTLGELGKVRVHVGVSEVIRLMLDLDPMAQSVKKDWNDDVAEKYCKGALKRGGIIGVMRLSNGECHLITGSEA